MTVLNEQARREPLLEEKYRALDEFLRRLKAQAVWERITKVVLYGSVVRGDAGEESDIDVLLVSTGDLREVEEVASDVAFSVLLDLGQRVEPMVYCPEDFSSSRSFLAAVRKGGKEVYTMPEKQRAEREAEDLLELAHTYLTMAKSLLAPESVRGAIDLAYNAAELCVRAFLLLRLEGLPRTHSGLLQQFSQLFIKKEKVIKPDLGRALNRALERRNKSRYDPHAVLTEVDARAVLQAAERMLQALEAELEKE
ncbi:MAG: HEPN domain-containing protein [Thermodesulfobacteriota bacterium]|jgi:uncharacterized protein (UPF0332 family)/predicted nucleotidyltransferase